MKCIESEVEYLTLMVQLNKRDNKQDEVSFFEFRQESLQFQKESIETNIETGVTTPESYTADIKGYLAAQKKLMMEAAKALGATNEHTQRIKKRVRLITEEIQEIEGGSEEQAQTQ